jgi:phage shock protein PspC (stress-responsive transcriptional regulator)
MTTNRLQVLRRPARGRILGGVCAGIAHAREIPVWLVRLAFLAAALLGGLGAVIYPACCLILPGDEDHPERNGVAVTVALVCAALVGLATLSAAGAAATVFGYGWIVVALAGAVLFGFMLFDGGPAWALLPIAALTLPSVAVATSGLTLADQVGTSVYQPAVLSPARTATYSSGLGMMLIDLRHTQLAPDQTVTLRIKGGIRRTIVALPDSECVNVDVNYDVNPFLARAASIISNRPQPFAGVVVFGRLQQSFRGSAPGPSHRAGAPSLSIDFTSQGGGLYVRNYPASIDPQMNPDWPGFPVTPEGSPDTRGMTRKGALALMKAYRARHSAEVASKQLITRLLPGPCGG